MYAFLKSLNISDYADEPDNESELSKIYDNVQDIFESLNKTENEVLLASGLVTAQTLANLTNAKNQSLTAADQIENLHLNLTTSDQDLAQDFIQDLDKAQGMLEEFITIINNYKPPPFLGAKKHQVPSKMIRQKVVKFAQAFQRENKSPLFSNNL